MTLAEPTRKVQIPYRPRRWALPFHNSLKRWAALVLHRRAGKTTAIINHHLRYALTESLERKRLKYLSPGVTEEHLDDLCRSRVYGHVLPTYKQAKLTAWEMVKHYAGAIPGREFNESELMVKLPGGSRLVLFGADNPDALRGSAFSGISFDEYGMMHPNVFSEVLSKSLGDHLGYAIFAGTIKGKNQLWESYQAATKGQNAEDWFSLWQDIDLSLQTEQDASTVMLRQALLDDQKLVQDKLMSQEEYDQEWYLSVEAAIFGAYYTRQLVQARKDGRITRVPYDPSLPVDTDWDIGVDDYTSIWFSQSLRSGEVRLIDYVEDSDKGLDTYVRVLNEKPYIYGTHWGPHDIEVREWAAGARSRREIAAGLGVNFQVMPRMNPADRVTAARAFIGRCWFDEEKCAAGIEALQHYRKAFNERTRQFTGNPVHDWSCVTGDTKVLARDGAHRIDSLPETGEVLTPCGWKTYLNPHRTRVDAPLVAVTFSDGLTVRCTPDHLFLTVSGWRYASNLRPGSQIQSSWTRSRSTSMEGSIVSGLARRIGRVVAASCTAMFGKRRSALFRRAAIFITGTGSRRITCSPTWNVFLLESTGVATQVSGPDLMHSATTLGVRLPSGTAQMPVGRGIEDTPSVPRGGRSGSESLGPASSVGLWSRCWSGAMAILSAFAPRHARVLRIVSVVALDSRADVWCLTVPDGHVWSLENGAVTHNSHGADSFGQLASRHKPHADARRHTRKRRVFEGRRMAPSTPSSLDWMG